MTSRTMRASACGVKAFGGARGRDSGVRTGLLTFALPQIRTSPAPQ
jgi:hypothetical protein